MPGAMGSGFVPPPYPYERLDELRVVADAHPGGVVDCSVGTPIDPVPDAAIAAIVEAARESAGYPPSIGTLRLREAAARWLRRRFGVDLGADGVAASIGTKELVASLPHVLHRRRPERDTVLHPAIAYPTYEMGARLADLRAVPVPLDDDWHLRLDAIDEADARRALVLWVNEPGNPTASAAEATRLADTVEWARARDVLVASDECYAEFAPHPASALVAGSEGVLAVHSVSKRSNLAGLRVGFYAGDGDVVSYVREVRKHAGFMVPTVAQAAAAAVLDDDEHAAEQRRRYEERRDLLLEGLGRHGYRHVGGPTAFYLWLRGPDGDGWDTARRLASAAGLLVAPGELYGAAGAPYARLALVQPTSRLELAVARLDGGAPVVG
jgi:succinyldiaminopimelate transaminase